VERKLRLSPHVAEAIALSGGARPYVTAMMSIDAGNVGAWAQHRHLGFSTYAELAQRPEVYELVAEHVARVNRDLPAAARVRRFVLLHRPLDDDGRELTHTRTLRRAVVDERYADVVDALYADASHVTVTLAATAAAGAPPAAANGARPEAAITLAIRSMDGAGRAAAPAARTRQVARSA
ncbi:MAG: long-chain acyl-CoA synthetase, partial [Solirubrobacteraceae bacterium]|nr:long-chain acyl-CoA synthetase [Solirubrobacteraceae bacterium]